MEEDKSIVPVEAVDQLLPALSDFNYIEGEDAEHLRQEAAAIRADLVEHNRQRLRIGARLVRLEPLLKSEQRFVWWVRTHFCAPDAAYKVSYETIINYMNLVKYSANNPQIPAKVSYEVYRNNPDQWRVAIAQDWEKGGRLTWESARVIRRAPSYVVERLEANNVDLPTAYQFTEKYVRAPQPVQRLIEETGSHQPVTVDELSRAYELEGQGKTKRWSDLKDDKSLNFISGERVPLGDVTPLHWHKWLAERQIQHIEHSSLVKYDWMADQVGELYVIPAGESVMMSSDEDTLVFVIKHPPPDLIKKAGRKGKIRMGLEAQTSS